MDSERWQRIETLFDAALDRDPSRWDTFLDEHCQGDLELRAEVARLLASHVPPERGAAGRSSRFRRLLSPRAILVYAAVLAVLTIAFLGNALRLRTAELEYETHRRRAAEETARDAQWSDYTSTIAAAEASIRLDQTDDARALLARTPEHHRGWEWRHLERRLDRSLYALRAHQRTVTRVAFAPDGASFVTSSLDGTLGFWATETGDSIRRLGPLSSGVESLALHPDSVTAAVGLSSGSVLLLALDSGAERARLSGSGRAMVAFNPAGTRLAAAFQDGTVAEWRTDTNKPTATIDAGGTRLCVAYSGDGRFLITGDDQGHAKLWDTRTNRRAADVAAHDGRITDVAAGDGGVFATASTDHTVKVWRVSDRRPIATCRAHGAAVVAVAFEAGGAHAVSADAGGRVLRWSAASGAVVSELRSGEGASALAIEPHGGRVAVGDNGGGVRLWPQNADDVRAFRAPADESPQPAVNHARVSPDGRTVACAANHLEIDLWDAAAGEPAVRIETGRADYPTRVAFSPSGSHLFAGDRGGNVIAIDLAQRRRLLAFAAHPAAVLGLEVSPDGAVLVSAGADSTMKFWDAHTLAPRGEFRGLSGTDRAIRFWNPQTGDTLRALRAHASAVVDVAFNAGGTRLLSVAKDGTVRLWDVAAATSTAVTGAAGASVACFTPDGTRIAAGGAEPAIRIIDVATGRAVARLHGHTGRILSLESSPQHDRLVSASFDGTLRLWDAE
jgi:WD40 repeat protein